MDYNPKKIGARISAERKALGESQGALAVKLNYVESYRQMIGRWESGTELPSLDNALKLCKEFNCQLGYLLCEPEYTLKTKQKTDIHTATGLSESTIDKLQTMKESTHSQNGSIYQDMIDCLNELFDKGFGDILLDMALFKGQIRLFKKDKASKTDLAAASIVGNYGKDRLPGTAVLSQRDYYNFKVQQIEREFGELLKRIATLTATDD